MTDTLKIAVVPGDGTGPEVTNEALKVLEAVAPLENVRYERTDFDYGGDRYLATGEVITEAQIDELGQFDAIYLGAIGHPGVTPACWKRASSSPSASSSTSTSTSVPSASTPAWIAP